MKRHPSSAAVLLCCALLAGCSSARPQEPAPEGPFPGLDRIRTEDLRGDMFVLASDAFRGREAGTLDELRASGWLAERARAAGLLPAGEAGSYFQFWPMRRLRTSDLSTITIGGQPVALWRTAALSRPVEGRVDAPIVFLDSAAASGTAADLAGKAVVAPLLPPTRPPAPGMSLWDLRYTRAAVRDEGEALAKRGAAAVLLVADSIASEAFGITASGFARGRYAVDEGPPMEPAAPPPVLLVRPEALATARAAGARFVADLRVDRFVYPSVNVVAIAPGRDPALRNEYVLFSGHQDHDGVRAAIDGDSIWNGADDNASTTVAMLAIGRAFAARPGKRSALFVWHGAEERGLLGSRWFATHPLVVKDSIVAVLNGDMVGRNAPDTAALLGVIPPHRNSVGLVQAALEANRQVTHFVVDSSWDRADHPEHWYFRSDHLSYAKVGVPAIFFTTLLHPDYHTPRDEASRIDMGKLTRMAQWMYATGWLLANAPDRPTLDPTYSSER